MSTVKITELSELEQLNSNTDLTILVGVDIESDITGKISATTLAEGLYAHNVLNVGNNAVVFADVIGQFVSEGTNFLQVNLQNTNGNASSDYVATADNGTDSTNFIDVGINGSTFNDSNYSSMKANDGYVVVVGDEGQPGGNIIIGTATTGTQIKFIAGGLTLDNIIGTITNTGAHFPNIDTAISANLTLSETYTDTANTKMKSYVDAANTNLKSYTDNHFLANTTGIFGGDLTVTGNVIVKTSARIQNAAMPANNQYLIITGTAGGEIGVPSNPGYTIHTAIDGGNRVVSESYSNTSSDYASYIGRRARGTAANPLPVQSGDTIVRFGGNGYGTTKFSQFSDGRIEVVATENHTDNARGTKIRFMNTMDGSNVATEIASFNANTVTFSGVVNPSKGLMYTPNVLTANATTYTLDFSRDSMLKYSVNDNSTITLQNFQPGKIVELWITNSSAQNKTITHGCLSTNATSKATSFTILSNSSAFLKYFSINGDQANTFVSITA